MRIAVVGPGSIGGYFAAQAARAGHEVILCARTPFDRLVIETVGPAGTTDLSSIADPTSAAAASDADPSADRRSERLTVDAPVVTDPRALAPCDWVLLAVKAHQTRAVADWLRAACGPRTRAVAVLQNGVEHRERVAPLVDATPVLPATVLCAAEATAPGHIVHHGYSQLDVPAGPLADELAALFAGSDVSVVPRDDFATAAWSKLALNAATNPITALTDRRIDVLRRPDVQHLAHQLIAEAVHVAHADGAAIPPGVVDGLTAASAAADPRLGTSMLYDRRAGRRLEYDAINGAVVRIGARHGVATPMNAAMVALLAAIDEAASSEAAV